MRATNANAAQFLFLCGDLDISTFQVVKFSGKDSISEPYSFMIELRSGRSDISSADMLNKSASLFIYRFEEFFPYSGVIVDFNYVETSTDFSVYKVQLVPHLYLLEYNIQTRIFQNMTVPEITKKILDETGFSEYYTFDLQGSYPKREFIVQYKESDLNFISRLLEDSGIWFFFKELPLLKEEIEKVSSESIVFSDKPGSFVNINGDSEIGFYSQSGLFHVEDEQETEFCYKLSLSEKVSTKNVLVKNYNYQTPEVNISAQKAIDDGLIGTCYEYGGNFKDPEMAQKCAAQLAKRFASEIVVVTGNSVCRGFRAGMRFTLREHVRSQCNDSYLITSVEHEGGHASVIGNKEKNYSNTFSLLPSKRVTLYTPPKRHNHNSLNGIITAPIETNGSEYASIDERGRYKVRFPFDISDTKNSEASKFVRLAQPYSGAKYGMHFPSHEGAEMILACIDGNPDKPLGIGTVPNANTTSPVTSVNKEQSVIKTAGNNEIILDDTNKKQKIRITTAAKNTIVMDDENRLIKVLSTDGNQLLIDDKNKVTSLNADKHNLQMSYQDNYVVITSSGGHIIKMDDKGKKLTIQTSAGHIIQMDDDGSKLTMTDCKGKNTVTLDGQKGFALDSKGAITITAKEDIKIKGANISLEASSGNIEMKATKDMSLSGININNKANTAYKVKALNAEMTADSSMKIKGSMSTDVSGLKTSVNANTALVLKGTVVQIN